MLVSIQFRILSRHVSSLERVYKTITLPVVLYECETYLTD